MSIAYGSRLTWGILGVGRAGAAHVRHLTRLRDSYRIVAACDIDPERLRGLECEHFRHWSEVIDARGRLDLDGVTVALPPEIHAEAARTFLQAGCAVFCEKPLAVTPAEVAVLGECAAQSGVTLDVVGQLVHEPPTALVVKTIREGGLGRVLDVSIRLRSKGKRSSSELILAFASHHIGLAVALAGDLVGPPLDRIAEDGGRVLFRLEHRGGAISRLRIESGHDKGAFSVAVAGTAGSVLMEDGFLAAMPEELRARAEHANEVLRRGLEETPIRTHFGPGLSTHYLQLAEFVRQGRTNPYLPRALATARAVCALLEFPRC